MCGKSAHGRYRKYGYYEHSWASKRGATFTKEVFKCDPHRISAKKLEETIYENVKSLLSNPKYAEDIVREAQELHKKNSIKADIVRLKKKIGGYESNEAGLVERLSELPKSVSPAPIYRQLERLQEARKEAEEALLRLEMDNKNTREMPVDLKSYQGYLALVKRAIGENHSPELRSQLIKRLIYRIDIGTDKVHIHYYAGSNHVGRESSDSNPIFFGYDGSRTLTSGAGEGT